MEITTLFTEQKWNILQSLAEHEASPLQLAQSSNTTIANISQQLRLLEAAELVKKQKIKNRDKGKPRTLFSLSNDYSYIISAMNHFAGKRLLILDDYHKFVLRVLHIEDASLHYYLSKLYWKIEDILPQIDSILMLQGSSDINLMIISDKDKEIEKKVNQIIIKNPSGEQKKVSVTCLSKENFTKTSKQKKPALNLSNSFILYDPEALASSILNQKGDD